MVCIRFTYNIQKIHEFLFLMREYLEMAIGKIKAFGNIITQYKTYVGFYNDMYKHQLILEGLQERLEKIHPLKISFNKCQQMGMVMNLFYQLYNNKEYEDSITYSFECIGNVGCMVCWYTLILIIYLTVDL